MCLTCTSFDDTKGEILFILVRIVFEKKTCSANLVFMKSLHEYKKGSFGRKDGEWGVGECLFCHYFDFEC